MSTETETITLEVVRQSIKEVITSIYLDYVNNYLTVEKMSYDYQLPKEELLHIIEIGRRINNKVVTE